MEYAENWNYIVSRYNELYNSPENLVQRDWEDYFLEIFGYRVCACSWLECQRDQSPFKNIGLFIIK